MAAALGPGSPQRAHQDPRAEGHREAFLAKFGNIIDSAVPRRPLRPGAGSEVLPVDKFRSMVYDDMLLAAARRNYSGLDLHTVDDNRRQWYDSQKALRFDRQRDKEREWEGEMWLRSERQKSRLRERERELTREREWERLCERERDRARDREREWEREKEELRRQWIEERERQREREREKEAQWEISLEMEREQFRAVVREWEREKEAHRLQVRQQEWEWEQERERLRKSWEKRRKEEQQMEQALLDEMDQERRIREEEWEKERLELMERYAVARHKQAAEESRIGAPAAPSRQPSAAPSRRTSKAPTEAAAASQAPQSRRPSQAASASGSVAGSRRPSRAPAAMMTEAELQGLAEVLHKVMIGKAGDTTAAAELAKVHSDQEWMELQAVFRAQHKGRLAHQLAEELSGDEMQEVRDALQRNGVNFDAAPAFSPTPAPSGRESAAPGGEGASVQAPE